MTLFLLCIRPSFELLSPEEADKVTVPQRLGLQYVRVCEIIDIRDEEGAEDVYSTFNVLMRKPKENNFKAILESIRDLMNEYCIVPEWLHNVFLGYGNPSAAQWPNMPNLLETVDFKDTFLNANHLSESFPDYEVSFINAEGAEALDPSPPFRITLPKTLKGNAAISGNKISEVNSADNVNMVDASPKEKLIVEAYTSTGPRALSSGPAEAELSWSNYLWYSAWANYGGWSTRDVQARYLLRLGQGEQELATDLDFSRQGRVIAMLVRRLELLNEVERLARSLQLPEDVGYTCETAGYFWLLHICSRWELFLAACAGHEDKQSFVRDGFPFKDFFSDTPKPVFSGESFEKDMRAAKGCFSHIKTVFQELEECRAFELLKSTADRANYLMTKQAKIVAMMCTHAALKRRDFLQLGFKYDNSLMEDSAQILEIETFIPMLLQRQEDGGHARLKRCILIGDHHQLPPVVKNMAFQRKIVTWISVCLRGRARPSLAKLYNWRYRDLGDLSIVKKAPIFQRANTGFSYEYQLVNVPDYEGKGELTPSPWVYQNQGEAECIVSVYIYMRLLGYPVNKISILTTFNGQKLLICDVINRRCVPYPFIGPPSKAFWLQFWFFGDYSGQQNDFILLSLVRTRFVGHLRDVRRLVVAMSRARLGFAMSCNQHFNYFFKDPSGSDSISAVEKVGNPYLVHDVEELAHIVHDRMNQFYQERYKNNMPQTEDGNHDMESDSVVGAVDGDESERNMQQLNQALDIDGELSKEVDNNGFSSENGKADEKN
ncbi:predicted protein [Arabidopsis lyrata subsp. lyrata]|uniref:Predicted protein n=1 Tax=Arabidopsis lyrata subsp. lyrata TaxID=81972 RepID=D7LFG7_ARALL|nr:predicted protein [Arabidopsis lyrata subsp. lyrata]